MGTKITMPYALMIVFGDQVEAWKAYDETLGPEVPRVALVDTYWDEKVEAVRAAEALEGRLSAVRLDTPGSRKGDFSCYYQGGSVGDRPWELQRCWDLRLGRPRCR